MVSEQEKELDEAAETLRSVVQAIAEACGITPDEVWAEGSKHLAGESPTMVDDGEQPNDN